MLLISCNNLQVHKLIPITPSINQADYNLAEQYVIKTNPDNVISAICSEEKLTDEGVCPIEKLNDEGYYLITGAPDITLKFPWTELVLIIIMMLMSKILLLKWNIFADF